ncbi:MAG: 4-alpha-glucanotransferase [Acidimicrobiia bacterium]
MMDLQAWGIAPGYHDHSGTWREAPAETIDAVGAAMGADGAPVPPGTGDDEILLVRGPDDDRGLPPGEWDLTAEDGGSAGPLTAIPGDLGFGYHTLVRRHDGRTVTLITSPGRCHLPGDLRTWGWAIQLYAARSRDSWGMGDLGDLRRLAEWSAAHGAGMALVNPLHANIPGGEQPSPYYPSSRCFLNPIYLRVEDVPGAADAGADLSGLAGAGRALNGERRVDREAVRKLKGDALDRIWERFRSAGGDDAFERFRVDGRDALFRYAVHCTLSESLDGPWPGWPEEYRRPESPAVDRFADDHADRVAYHQWLQWCTNVQLAHAGAGGVDVMSDLAIGVDPAGADAWLWQDAMALDMRVGAPPDEFNTRGQDWSIPPFDPWRIRLVGYEPYIRTLRAGFRGGGALRFDHVMGLFRLFWIPPEAASPAEGTYVAYRFGELLDILALESHRAGAYVVGEDLGTVEDYMRNELAERDVLSYRLLWFEPTPPSDYPAKALAAVTTHDLPTVAGLWSGADLDEQRKLGLEPNEEATAAMKERFGALLGAGDDEPAADVVVGAYGALAQASSMILTATLDDALAVEERPNVPGTVDERPNWSIALPVPIEELEHSPTAAAIAAALRRD